MAITPIEISSCIDFTKPPTDLLEFPPQICSEWLIMLWRYSNVLCLAWNLFHDVSVSDNAQNSSLWRAPF